MKLLKAIITSLFALLFLVMSSGFVVNKHYCGNELQSAAINGAPDACEMQKAPRKIPPCHKVEEKSDQNEMADDCCQDESDWYKTDQFSFDSYSWEVQLPVLYLHLREFILNIPEEVFLKSTKILVEDPPPPDDVGAVILFQSFLL